MLKNKFKINTCTLGGRPVDDSKTHYIFFEAISELHEQLVLLNAGVEELKNIINDLNSGNGCQDKNSSGQ